MPKVNVIQLSRDNGETWETVGILSQQFSIDAKICDYANEEQWFGFNFKSTPTQADVTPVFHGMFGATEYKVRILQNCEAPKEKRVINCPSKFRIDDCEIRNTCVVKNICRNYNTGGKDEFVIQPGHDEHCAFFSLKTGETAVSKR